VDYLQKPLLNDHDYLLDKANYMSKRCEVSSDILVNAIAVLEAQKSIQQAAQVNKLTSLAFWYIPVSFVASVLGMNVEEIAERLPPLWVFFAVATPLTALSLLLASLRNFFLETSSFRGNECQDYEQTEVYYALSIQLNKGNK